MDFYLALSHRAARLSLQVAWLPGFKASIFIVPTVRWKVVVFTQLDFGLLHPYEWVGQSDNRGVIKLARTILPTDRLVNKLQRILTNENTRSLKMYSLVFHAHEECPLQKE